MFQSQNVSRLNIARSTIAERRANAPLFTKGQGGLMLCHSLIFGLCATGYASARSPLAGLQSTGIASGTLILSCDKSRDRFSYGRAIGLGLMVFLFVGYPEAQPSVMGAEKLSEFHFPRPSPLARGAGGEENSHRDGERSSYKPEAQASASSERVIHTMHSLALFEVALLDEIFQQRLKLNGTYTRLQSFVTFVCFCSNPFIEQKQTKVTKGFCNKANTELCVPLLLRGVDGISVCETPQRIRGTQRLLGSCLRDTPLPIQNLQNSATSKLAFRACLDETAAEPESRSYRDDFKNKQRLAEQKQTSVIEGVPGWLFFTPELRAVVSEPFWGDRATTVSRSSNPKYADPLEPILNFHAQLKAAEIELWIVPVPAKACVYPENCVPDAPTTNRSPRIDTAHAEFYQQLREKGVTVVDLTEEFRKRKSDAKAPLYCQSDSHWSGQGAQVAATTLASEVKQTAWYESVAKRKFRTEPHSVEITGDLALLLSEKNPIKEKLALTRVVDIEDGKARPVTDDSTSPLLLLGDSHTLVFHDPSLYAEGCGLADHLAERLGFRLDVIGVRGSGANAARLNWRRRADPLAGKKLVIWCFSMREFTENTDGWRKIPIVK